MEKEKYGYSDDLFYESQKINLKPDYRSMWLKLKSEVDRLNQEAEDNPNTFLGLKAPRQQEILMYQLVKSLIENIELKSVGFSK